MKPIVHNVQHAQKLSQLQTEVKGLNREVEQAERTNVERGWNIGKRLVVAKEICPSGEWGQWLEAAGISDTRASAYMRLTKFSARRICQFASIRDALKTLVEEEKANSAKPTETGVSGGEPTEREPGDESEHDNDPPETPTPAAPPAPLIFCRNCRIYQPKPGCKDCEALRRERDGPTDDKPPKKPATKNGTPILLWPDFHSKFGQVVRAVDHVANAGDVKHMGAAQQLKQDLDGWLKRFAAYYEQVTGEKAPEIAG